MKQLSLNIDGVTIYTKQDPSAGSHYSIWITKDKKEAKINTYYLLNCLLDSNLLECNVAMILKKIYEFNQTDDAYLNSKNIENFTGLCNKVLDEGEKTSDQSCLECISLGGISLSVPQVIKIFEISILIEKYINKTDKDVFRLIVSAAITLVSLKNTTQNLFSDIWIMKNVLLMFVYYKTRDLKLLFFSDFSDLDSEDIVQAIFSKLNSDKQKSAVHRLDMAKKCLDLQDALADPGCVPSSDERKIPFLNIFIIFECLSHEYYVKGNTFDQIKVELLHVRDKFQRFQLEGSVDESFIRLSA